MPAPTTYEQAAAALFSLAATAVPGLKLSARRRKMPQDVPPGSTPALFQVQIKTLYEYTGGGLRMPPKRTMLFDLVLYTSDDANIVNGLPVFPSTQLNTMIQAIETAMAPDPTTGSSTLGGIVASARIQGEIDYHETPILSGLSVAIIPVAVLIP